MRSVSHSVWQIGSDHASREEESVLVRPGPEATQEMLGVFACGIEVCLMYSHSWGTVGGDEETAGRAKGECNEECV